MNSQNWTYVYKGHRDSTNLVYTPLTNGNKMCMHFDHTNWYQNGMIARGMPLRPDYNKDLVDYFFAREIEYIHKLRHKSYAPLYTEIDKTHNKIFFQWPGESCDNILHTERSIEKLCPNWKTQLRNIVTDLYTSGIFKLTLYPHCFFIENGVLKTFDFYGCAEVDNPYIEHNRIKGMIGNNSIDRFTAATEGNKINTRILFQQAVLQYSGWPENPLRELFDLQSKVMFD